MILGERIKLEIEKLKLDRDYLMFEYSNVNSLWIGVVAFLLAIFIPIIVSLKNNIVHMVYASVSFVALVYISHFVIGKMFLDKKEEELICLNCKLNEKYKSLGVQNEQ